MNWILCVCSIIFVHLGDVVPRCLPTTLKQAQFFNRDSSIYLLTNNKTLKSLCEENITVVDVDEIPKTDEHRTFEEVNQIDPAITHGLWAYALERFFTLHDFIKERNLENVFHLENDTMLYVDVNEMLPLFTHMRLAAPFQSLVGCIPCLVYIKDQDSLTFLIDHVLSEMKDYDGLKPHLQVNDMQLLASLYTQFGEEYLFPLPTLMPEYKSPKRRSVFGQDNRTPLRFLSLYADRFLGYLFDAAGLGIYLNGNDGQEITGRGPGTIHSRCLFNPGFFSYSWANDDQGRKIPYLSFKGNSYRIVNLHFHSKMPDDYRSFP